MPSVSIVLIFLNEERFLEEAVNSVIAQTLQDWELILVDDGSTDRSTGIARHFAAIDYRIRYLEHDRHQNLGMSASRNLGASMSTAPYLAFLDGDDVWVAEKLAEQLEVLTDMPEIGMVCGAMRYWHSWDPATAKADAVVLTGGLADQMIEPPNAALLFHPLGQGSGSGVDVMVRREIFDAVGGFEGRFRGLFEDQAFLLKVFFRYRIYVSSRAWLLYRQHDDSCVQQSTGNRYVRRYGEFLDWLENEVEVLGDRRVSESYRRAKRASRRQRVLVPLRFVYHRVRGKLPATVRARLARIVGN